MMELFKREETEVLMMVEAIWMVEAILDWKWYFTTECDE